MEITPDPTNTWTAPQLIPLGSARHSRGGVWENHNETQGFQETPDSIAYGSIMS